MNFQQIRKPLSLRLCQESSTNLLAKYLPKYIQTLEDTFSWKIGNNLKKVKYLKSLKVRQVNVSKLYLLQKPFHKFNGLVLQKKLKSYYFKFQKVQEAVLDVYSTTSWKNVRTKSHISNLIIKANPVPQNMRVDKTRLVAYIVRLRDHLTGKPQHFRALTVRGSSLICINLLESFGRCLNYNLEARKINSSFLTLEEVKLVSLNNPRVYYEGFVDNFKYFSNIKKLSIRLS